jgi:hypothetical protein
MASEEFSCHGCSDFDLVCDGGLLSNEADDLRRRYHAWNGDPDEYEPGRTDLSDFAAMSFLAHLLEEEGLRVEPPRGRERDREAEASDEERADWAAEDKHDGRKDGD